MSADTTGLLAHVIEPGFDVTARHVGWFAPGPLEPQNFCVTLSAISPIQSP